MPLHILKLCVGAESISDLEEWLAERQAQTLIHIDDPRCSHDGGGPHHGAQDMRRRDSPCQEAVRIDAAQPVIPVRAFQSVEVPPRHAVHGGDDDGVGSKQARDAVGGARCIVSLGCQEDGVLGWQRCRIIGAAHRNTATLGAGDAHLHAVGPQRRQTRTARHQHDVIGPAGGEARAQVSADGAGAVDADSHPAGVARLGGQVQGSDPAEERGCMAKAPSAAVGVHGRTARACGLNGAIRPVPRIDRGRTKLGGCARRHAAAVAQGLARPPEAEG